MTVSLNILIGMLREKIGNGLPKYFWSHAVLTAYLFNKLVHLLRHYFSNIHRLNYGMDIIPSIKHFHMLDCVAYKHNMYI